MATPTFHEKVKYYLLSSGYSQKDMAEEVHIHPTDLSKKLKGHKPFTPNEVLRIIEYLAASRGIQSQRQAHELLSLMKLDSTHFSPAQWRTSPLKDLESLPDNEMAMSPVRVLDEQEAQRHLDKLPLGRPSRPQNMLPAGSLFDYPRNDFFTGREAELLQLASILKDNVRLEEHAVVPVSMIVTSTGPGGVGKTQLANEFVYRYGRYFLGGVFWLNFADERSIPTQVAACGGPGALELAPDFTALPLNTQVKHVKAEWKKALPRLLIFDNCDNEALFHQWRPPYGGCRILVTSRRAQWGQGFGIQTRSLQVFQRAESRELLGKFLSPTSPDIADLEAVDIAILDAIANELGDFPLALHLAGSYLRLYKHTITLDEYLKRLQDSPQALIDDISLIQGGFSPTHHIQHVARTFAVSYRRLDLTSKEGRRAQKALARAAHFAPGESIPRILLRRTLHAGPHDYDNRIRLDEAFSRLLDLGLMEMGSQGTLRMHRLIADFTLKRVETNVDEQAREAVEQVIIDTLRKPQDQEIKVSLSSLEPHFLTVINGASDRLVHMGNQNMAVTTRLVLDPYLIQWGRYEAVISEYEKIHDSVTLSGLDMQRLIHLGNAYMGKGHSQKAVNCYQAAVDIARQENDQEYYGLTLGLLAIAYMKLGRTQEALNLYNNEALPSSQETGNSALEAKWLINLGVCCYNSGLLDHGVASFVRAQAIADKLEEGEYITTEVKALIVTNLSFYYHSQGQSEKALLYDQRALELIEAYNYRLIKATCLGNMGDGYATLARYEQAHNCLEQALSLCEQYGLDGCKGNVLHSLAELCIDEEQYDMAIEHLQEGIRIGRDILADPQILSSCYTALTRAYLSTGAWSAAHDAAIAAKEYTTVILNEHYALALLGIAEMFTGLSVEAMKHFQQVLELTSKLLSTNTRYCKALDTRALAAYSLVIGEQSKASEHVQSEYCQERSKDQDVGTQRRIQRLFTILEHAGKLPTIQDQQ